MRAGNLFQTEELRVDLRIRLLEAVLWGSRKADLNHPLTCLRSELLRPYVFNDSRQDSLCNVVDMRHWRLVEEGIIPDFLDVESVEDLWKLMPPLLGGGRLLAWERDLTIDDGLGETLTKGYLDASDMAPWDTWVTYVPQGDDERAHTGYLVSWVPPSFVPSVSEAVEGNAYDALYWLKGRNLLVGSVLQNYGWLF